MFNFCSLFSGSSGNCLFVESDNAKILIDCGVSLKKINESLKNFGLSVDALDGILITHEHSDHTKALGTITKRYNIPIYANIETAHTLKDVNLGNFKYFRIDEDFKIGDICVKPFSIPHDAANPCGFSIYNNRKKLTIATDIGHMNDYVLENLKYSNFLLLESNYEPELLNCSKYPFNLKRRIAGPNGHLPNSVAGKTISYLYNYNLETVFLGHLSKENNIPELAYQSVISELHNNNIDTSKITVEVASRDVNSKLIELC
ncbi:MAG: MBL fold metallo-hydrolase [Candidatus Scatovivens sp.]